MRGGAFTVAVFGCAMSMGAASAEIPGGDPHESWLPAGMDWEKSETVVVDLADNLFEPAELEFQRGRPYRLILRNVGDKPHDLVDTKFYHSIVLHSITSATGTVRTPHVHSISVQPKAETTVHFVAVKPGSFDIFCSIPGHREDGMEGRFRVR